jgi:hypothetical protein
MITDNAKKMRINKEIKLFTIRVVQEVLADHDFGLELTVKAKKRLKSANAFKGRSLSFSEIRKKFS